MIIRQTTNQDEIKKILFHPAIYPNISEGIELDFNTTDFPTDNAWYLGGYNDDIFAVSCFHSFQDGLKFHPNILPEFRRKYARDFVKRCLDMVKCRIYIEIPTKRKELFNFARKFGFDSITNNSAQHDKILMELL